MTELQVGYHRISDDSVSSSRWSIEEAAEFILELSQDDDVDHAWFRTAEGGPYTFKEGGINL